MGSVIYLSQGTSSKQKPKSTRAREGGPIALVLGGGGITGAAYHLGVLNAMNSMSTRATVNHFDIYVGTSAGAVVASCLANGITPEELILANLGHESTTIPARGPHWRKDLDAASGGEA